MSKEVQHDIHESAELFPMMDAQEFTKLCESIDRNGQQEPIWTVDGKVIDGRNRLKACDELGIEPMMEERGIEESQVVDVVLALNLDRRHLSASQRAMVASKVSRLRGSSGVGSLDEVQNCTSKTQAEAADELGVSLRSVKSARHVEDHGTPELRESVESGEVSVSVAAIVADLPDEAQRKAVKSGKSGASKAAKKAKKETEPKRKPKQHLDSLSAAVTRARHDLGQIVQAWPSDKGEMLADILAEVARGLRR